MIRVFTTKEPSAIVITIDGQLLGDYVDVAKSVDEAIAERLAVHLFLRDVSLIDDHGRTLLAGPAVKGVKLRASGVYSSCVIDEIRREAAEPGKRMRTTGLPRSTISDGPMPEVSGG